jgi:hypothetical protein
VAVSLKATQWRNCGDDGDGQFNGLGGCWKIRG